MNEIDIKIKIVRNTANNCGPGCLIGIATDYGLNGPRIKKEIPVGVRFFAHVQTGRGAHPASCIMGTGSFPGVKRPGRGTDPYTSIHPLGQFRSLTGLLYFYRNELCCKISYFKLQNTIALLLTIYHSVSTQKEQILVIG
jgi:hypothetical protein